MFVNHCATGLFLFGILFGGAGFGEAQTADFFPVMPWDHTPDDPAYLKRVRECGFTVAGFTPVSALDHCKEAGLKTIVYDARTADYDWAAVDSAAARKRLEELITPVKDHPALFGYYLRDEPHAGLFPGLATVSSIIRELDPDAWPYINLFPNYAEPGQLATPNYDAYLRTFVDQCKPPLLSYDHYHLYEGGSMGTRYFANLEALRRVSLDQNIPFQNIIQAVACLSFREATPADLNYQVYTSLAYGARGIVYFKYTAAAVGNFRYAAIDQFGAETPVWGMLQNVNRQIEKLAPTLLQLKSDAVYHFGDTPERCVGPGANSLVKSVPGTMVVGDFTHKDGSRYAMIVNKNLTRSVVCQPTLSIPISKLEFVSPYTGALTPFEGEQIWLAPGQGVLLKPTPVK